MGEKQKDKVYNIEYKLDFRTVDGMYPRFWKEDPERALEENKKNFNIDTYKMVG